MYGLFEIRGRVANWWGTNPGSLAKELAFLLPASDAFVDTKKKYIYIIIFTHFIILYHNSEPNLVFRHFLVFSFIIFYVVK